jgi:hypothetical protein
VFMFLIVIYFLAINYFICILYLMLLFTFVYFNSFNSIFIFYMLVWICMHVIYMSFTHITAKSIKALDSRSSLLRLERKIQWQEWLLSIDAHLNFCSDWTYRIRLVLWIISLTRVYKVKGLDYSIGNLDDLRAWKISMNK